MITFRDPEIARRARILRLHGIDRDVFARYQAGSTSSWGYEIVAPGFKSNMTDLAASIGIVQLKRARDFHIRRQHLFETYDRELAGLPIILPPRPQAGDVHAFHLYAIRLKEGAPLKRNEFISRMADLGVNCSVHFIPLHLHSYWRDTLGLAPEMFPEAQRVYENLVTLPLSNAMTDDMQAYVIDTMRRLLT
jgi:dTDP-4-amino-4,6-dideoxygalactose transaminase